MLSEYTELSEDLVVDVQEESPDLTANYWFVKCYVNGLQEGIKFQFRPLRPDIHFVSREQMNPLSENIL
jgi:hypothetical protein